MAKGQREVGLVSYVCSLQDWVAISTKQQELSDPLKGDDFGEIGVGIMATGPASLMPGRVKGGLGGLIV